MTVTRHPVIFECGHRSWLYTVEYGDGNAWCATCDKVLDCEDDDDAGPCDIRPSVTDADWAWRAAVSDDDVISLPNGAA